MGAPGFWDDQAEAARISTEHARVTRKLERYESLQREVDDATELLELDPALEHEVAEQVVPVRDELARLQEEALFNGEYDAGDAVVTITWVKDVWRRCAWSKGLRRTRRCTPRSALRTP